METKFKVGQMCTCRHYYAYRPNQLFTIEAIISDFIPQGHWKSRPVYVVKYVDGMIDQIAICSEDEYEMESMEDDQTI